MKRFHLNPSEKRWQQTVEVLNIMQKKWKIIMMEMKYQNEVE